MVLGTGKSYRFTIIDNRTVIDRGKNRQTEKENVVVVTRDDAEEEDKQRREPNSERYERSQQG